MFHMFQSRPEVGDLLPVGGGGAQLVIVFLWFAEGKAVKTCENPKAMGGEMVVISIFWMIVTDELMWLLASDVRDDGHFLRTCWLTAQLGPGFWRIYPQSWMTKGDLMWHCEIGWQDISRYQHLSELRVSTYQLKSQRKVLSYGPFNLEDKRLVAPVLRCSLGIGLKKTWWNLEVGRWPGSFIVLGILGWSQVVSLEWVELNPSKRQRLGHTAQEIDL